MSAAGGHGPGRGDLGSLGLTGPATPRPEPPAPETGRPVVVLPVSLLVIAKEPLPGRAKTRLTPPCSPPQAAALAAAALTDTIATVARAPVARRILVFDGNPRSWMTAGFEVVAQRGRTLGERLAAAFAQIPGPALLIGMDTPQLTPDLLVDGARALLDPGVDAVLGPALDGGYWSVGFSSPVPGAFDGVPMSHPDTCTRQRARLSEMGLRVYEPPPLRDVDTIDDARAIADDAPHTRFARTLRAME